MNRYQPYSRRELRTLFRTWLRLNRVRVAVFATSMVALIALETWCVSALHLSAAVRWYATGFVHATVLAVAGFAVLFVFLAYERDAIHQVRGAWGEDFTRDELKRARRKKLIWGWVDSVTVEGGDIDHLVVTKLGGIVAIDSKWRSASSEFVQADMARDARRAKLRAEAVVRSLLVGRPRAAHRAAANPFGVSPLVAVWGAAQKPIPEGAQIDGIPFVPGGKLVDWLARADGEVIDEAARWSQSAGVSVLRRTVRP